MWWKNFLFGTVQDKNIIPHPCYVSSRYSPSAPIGKPEYYTMKLWLPSCPSKLGFSFGIPNCLYGVDAYQEKFGYEVGI